MIRRDIAGQAILINQYDHSLLCGDLARQLGNGLFAAPSPFDSVVLANADHDCGWIEPDTRPDINAHGLPAHVFEGETLTALPAWQASVDRVLARDKYAGLLVSLHSMALANLAMSKEPQPTDEFARQKAFRIRKFVHGQIELQENLRRQLDMRVDLPLRGGLAEPGRSPDEDLLRCNFFLLQFLDQLSLDLCFDRLLFQRIEVVYPRASTEPLSARIARDPDGTMRLSPWPFNAQRLDLSIRARRIAAGPYRNARSLLEACDGAEPCSLRVVLTSFGS